jgi:hypothetical protein
MFRIAACARTRHLRRLSPAKCGLVCKPRSEEPCPQFDRNQAYSSYFAALGPSYRVASPNTTAAKGGVKQFTRTSQTLRGAGRWQSFTSALVSCSQHKYSAPVRIFRRMRESPLHHHAFVDSGEDSCGRERDVMLLDNLIVPLLCERIAEADCLRTSPERRILTAFFASVAGRPFVRIDPTWIGGDSSVDVWHPESSACSIHMLPKLCIVVDRPLRR